jgi:hypothetical protein
VCSRASRLQDKVVVDEAPRNVCAEHLLCSETLDDGTLCFELALLGEPFCKQHQRNAKKALQASSSQSSKTKSQCCGTTNRGKPCKATGFPVSGKKYFCPPHSDQASEASSSSSESSSDSDDEEDEEVEERLNAAAGDDFSNVVVIPAFEEIQVGAIGVAAEEKEDIAASKDGKDEEGDLNAAIALSLAVQEEPCALVRGEKETGAEEPAVAAAEGGEGVVVLQEVWHDAEESYDDVWVEADAADIHPDELDFDEEAGEEEEEELDFERERLQQTLGEELHHVEKSDSEDEEVDDVGGFGASSSADEAMESPESLLERVGDWSWEMPTRERLEALGLLLRHAGRFAGLLRAQAEGHLGDARRLRAEAAAQGFKKAHLIGATVVGATRRLEALRAAEPFAMVSIVRQLQSSCVCASYACCF